jgi:hypothetical protein
MTGLRKLFVYLRPHLWVLVVVTVLWLAAYGVFNSGRAMTCVWGLVMAITLFRMKLKHAFVYGLTEVAAGLFILAQNYTVGRGGFSAGFFNEAFQTFQGNVVLVSTLGAVYVMVRGFDNMKRGLSE